MTVNYPIIAIVGEPNVGKSSLFNRIIGQQIAVTSPVPGTTRDRQYHDSSWNGVFFTLVDTAGITFSEKSELEFSLNEQIDVALDQADMVWFVVDSKLPLSGINRQALLKFRKSDKPVMLVINKADSPKGREELVAEYQKLGIKPMFAISAINGRGTGDLLDQTSEALKVIDEATEKPEVHGIPVSIVGKPNVGKSSLLNRILNEKRVVVSPIAGTTRSAIDTYINIGSQDYTFIDTAGLKRKSRRQDLPDLFSGFHTFKAIRRSEIVLLVIDAVEPISKQDLNIAGEIVEMNKGLIVVANKIDLFIGDREKLYEYVATLMPFLRNYPIYFVSAETGEGVTELLDTIKPIYDMRYFEADQEHLNGILSVAMSKQPPQRMWDQRIPKIYDLKQVATNPPLFELTVNHPAAISKQFRGYLKKRISKSLQLWGTSIGLRLKGKSKT